MKIQEYIKGPYIKMIKFLKKDEITSDFFIDSKLESDLIEIISYNAYIDEYDGYKSVTIKAKKDCYLGLNIETYSDYDSNEADVDYLIIKVLEV